MGDKVALKFAKIAIVRCAVIRVIGRAGVCCGSHCSHVR
jgi:hypothetical protein